MSYQPDRTVDSYKCILPIACFSQSTMPRVAYPRSALRSYEEYGRLQNPLQQSILPFVVMEQHHDSRPTINVEKGRLPPERKACLRAEHDRLDTERGCQLLKRPAFRTSAQYSNAQRRQIMSRGQ